MFFQPVLSAPELPMIGKQVREAQANRHSQAARAMVESGWLVSSDANTTAPNLGALPMTSAAILSRALQLKGGNVPPDGARFILDLGIGERDKKRMLKLLAKQQRGRISAQEKADLESYIQADNTLSVLKAQAILALKKAGQEPWPMQESLERRVRNRAGERCEYCRIPSYISEFTFPVDHIIAKQHGGTTTYANLALSCPHDNFHKGPNIAGLDPETGRLMRLFNPRRQRWNAHFAWNGPMLVGKTPTGRTTMFVLNMNHPDRVEVRRILIMAGVFPP
jgi:hypothetical protein